MPAPTDGHHDAGRLGNLLQELAARDGRAALYCGDYLPNDVYEDWTIELCERQRSAYERLLLACQRASEQAIEVAEHLRVDPALEAAHRALVRYYAAAGWRDRAVQQYRHCALALKHKLGIEPAPETTRLYHHILHSQATDDERDQNSHTA
jgi:DNA-binding SARP family transcriptional activator